MKIRTVVVAVVLAALVASASPATAASANLAVASQVTTTSEFDAGSFTDTASAAINGDGGVAFGATAQRPADDSSGSTTNKVGIVIEPETDLNGITATLSSTATGATQAYLETTSGTVLDTATVSGAGDTVTFSASLNAGTQYRVVVDDNGDSFQVGWLDTASYPYQSTLVDIVDGYEETTTSSNAFAFRSVTALSDTGSYTTANQSVSDIEEVAVNVTTVRDGDLTLTAEYWDGSSWVTANQTTVTTTGNKTLGVTATASKWRLRTSFTGTGGAPDAFVSDVSWLFDSTAPTASNLEPADGSKVNNSSVNFSVSVSDADFGTAQGDEVTATLVVDGSAVGSDTVTSNGTATVSHSLGTGGEHDYYWELNDSYGDSTATGVQTVSAPASLTIREEQNPSELVNNTTVTVRFFGESDTVVERSVTNGTVTLTGLPVGQTFVVTAEADSGYYYRRIVLDSIYEQSTIYLLNESEPSAQVIFELDDRTGRFDASTTQLFIEAAIQRDFDGDGLNETRYQVIAGDNFGGAQSFPARLADAERYRLRIVNDEGETRVLGSYTTAGDAREILPVGEVALGREADTGRAATARLQTSDGQANIRLVYFDTAENTSELTVSVRDGNGTLVYGPVTTTGTFGGYVETIPLPSHTDGETYNVTIEGVRGGESFTISRTVGGVGPITDGWDIDSQLLAILASILSLALSGAVAIQDPPAAMIVLVASVGFSAALGFLTVDPLLLTFGGGLALLANAGRVR